MSKNILLVLVAKIKFTFWELFNEKSPQIER